MFEELSDKLGFTLVRNGLVMLCQTKAGFHEEKEVAEAARRLGIQAEVCGPERLRELDPGVTMNANGGVWFPQDAHLDSEDFLDAMRQGILRNGGEFLDGEVRDFEISDGSCKAVVLATGDRIAPDHLTIAGGSWSAHVTRRLGLRLLMQGGKGYSFTLPQPAELPRLCSLLKEGRVAVTPMGSKLRVAGTIEICGNDLAIDRKRLSGIIDSFCRFFPNFTPADFDGLETWGLPRQGSLKADTLMFRSTKQPSMSAVMRLPVVGTTQPPPRRILELSMPQFSYTQSLASQPSGIVNAQ